MKNYALIWIIVLLPVLNACDRARLLDENKDIAGNAWYFKNKQAFDVNIEDTNKTYNVYVNLRVGSDYEYCNMFVMLHQTTPSKKQISDRKELTLIDDAGNWLGHGLGDIYDYQLPVMKQVRFKEKGIYHFELEQNMRTDTLQHVYAAGIRIEDFAAAAGK